jgi:hypothetical protein
VPIRYVALHVPPQEMPPGSLVTVPPPLPVLLTVSTAEPTNVAVQDLAAVIVTTPSAQSASPDHPVNVEPPAADAVSVTTVPLE